MKVASSFTPMPIRKVDMAINTQDTVAIIQALSPVLSPVFSALTAWMGIRYHAKKNKAMEREINELKSQQRALIEDPFTL